MKKLLGCAALAATMMVAAPEASAFCGFYVNGAGGEMYADATQVVLMRMGTRTVLSMQNAYQGPVDDFALVIPVPVVLQEPDVKTLSKDVFAKVDAMGAPRLVEYWEQDPCQPEYPREESMRLGAAGSPRKMAEKKDAASDFGVTVEAKFVVGEYQIVILSAKDSTGLDGYLRSESYKIPEGAEPLLRPYVEAGSKFFVAKVDPKKVIFDGSGRAQLSPLRFHYDHEDFNLPIRLGLANSSGKQDLIVNILSPEGRFQVSNYKNVTIPTNLDVRDEVRNKFGEFYAALFDRTVEKNPGAVVTEYSWDASTCDPCPGPQLNYQDFAVLGSDVLGGGPGKVEPYQGHGLVLTRLHARYGRGDVPDDLVFAKATPIVGGREHVVDHKTGALEEGSRDDSINNFQGRYAIRHEWTGPIECQDPVRGRWGGPPGNEPYRAPVAAKDLAFAPRGQVQLPQLVAEDIPELGVKAAGMATGGDDPRAGSRGRTKSGDPDGKGKTGCGCQSSGNPAGWLVVLGLVAMVSRKRRSRV
jgi:MYXO-CTERM domain-containing protein